MDDECVGEHQCVIDGPCALNRKTLDEYCGRGERQCPLYFTKDSSVPDEYEALLEAAVRLKERSLNKQSIDEDALLFHEIHAYTVFSRAERIADKRKQERDAADADKPTKGEPGRGIKPGDSTAFAWSPEQLKEMDEQRRRREQLEKERRARRPKR